MPGGAPTEAPDHDTIMVHGGSVGMPAHEVDKEGANAKRYHAHAFETLDQSLIDQNEAAKAAFQRQQAEAQHRIDEGARKIAEGEAAKAKQADDRQKIQDQIAMTTQALAESKAPDMRMPSDASSMLMIFLGGLFTNADGSNPALKAYQQQIDTRVAQAKMKYEHTRDKAAALYTAYGHAVQEAGMAGADDLLKAAFHSKGLAEVDAMAARNGMADADPRLAQARAALSAGRDERLASTYGYVQASAAKAPDVFFDSRVGNGKVPMTRDQMVHLEMEDRKNGAEGADKTSKEEADRRGRFVATGPNGEGYLAPTAEEGKDDRIASKAREEALPMVAALASKIRGLGKADIALKGIYSTDKVISLKSSTKTVMDKLRLMSKGGSLDNGMVEHLEEQLGGNPTDWTANREGIAQSLDELIETLRAGGDAARRGSGAQSATQTVGKNKHGNIVVDPRGQAGTAAPNAAMPSTFK